MEIPFIVLGIITIGQLVERYMFARAMTDQLNKYMLANISKNSQEYITANIVDKATPTPQVTPDEVPLENASQEEFDKFIETQNS
jgi:hypothetical protein